MMPETKQYLNLIENNLELVKASSLLYALVKAKDYLQKKNDVCFYGGEKRINNLSELSDLIKEQSIPYNELLQKASELPSLPIKGNYFYPLYDGIKSLNYKQTCYHSIKTDTGEHSSFVICYPNEANQNFFEIEKFSIAIGLVLNFAYTNAVLTGIDNNKKKEIFKFTERDWQFFPSDNLTYSTIDQFSVEEKQSIPKQSKALENMIKRTMNYTCGDNLRMAECMKKQGLEIDPEEFEYADKFEYTGSGEKFVEIAHYMKNTIRYYSSQR